jgi:hypothetical protein
MCGIAPVTIAVNACSTLVEFLADVSIYGMLNESAYA